MNFLKGSDGILLRWITTLRADKVAGRESYRKIIDELGRSE